MAVRVLRPWRIELSTEREDADERRKQRALQEEIRRLRLAAADHQKRRERREPRKPTVTEAFQAAPAPRAPIPGPTPIPEMQPRPGRPGAIAEAFAPQMAPNMMAQNVAMRGVRPEEARLLEGGRRARQFTQDFAGMGGQEQADVRTLGRAFGETGVTPDRFIDVLQQALRDTGRPPTGPELPDRFWEMLGLQELQPRQAAIGEAVAEGRIPSLGMEERTQYLRELPRLMEEAPAVEREVLHPARGPVEVAREVWRESPIGKTLDAEQEYIAKRTQPVIRDALIAVGVPEGAAEPISIIASQIALPTSIVPFVGTGSRAMRLARAFTIGAGLSAAQEEAFVREFEGRDAELWELLLAAGAGGGGAAGIEVLPDLVRGLRSGRRAVKPGAGAVEEVPPPRVAPEPPQVAPAPAPPEVRPRTRVDYDETGNVLGVETRFEPEPGAAAPPPKELGALSRITEELRGAHHGQKDLSLYAFDDQDGILGRLDYVVFQGEPSISMVDVDPGARRHGIGRALVDRLQSEFPEQKIDWGMTTPEGTALRESIEGAPEAARRAPLEPEPGAVQAAPEPRPRAVEPEVPARAGAARAKEYEQRVRGLSDDQLAEELYKGADSEMFVHSGEKGIVIAEAERRGLDLAEAGMRGKAVHVAQPPPRARPPEMGERPAAEPFAPPAREEGRQLGEVPKVSPESRAAALEAGQPAERPRPAAEPERAPVAPEPQAADDLYDSVGAASAELPTQRAVEAQSARVPIEDKRVVANEILENVAPDARPLSVDEVAAQWGDRYKSNWFTKLDDVISRLRGRTEARQLEKSVRDTITTRDLYRQQEGYIQMHRVNAWVGRNKGALGLTDEGGVIHGTLQQDWRARGVQVREGAKIPKGAKQRLKDIREHPEDYILTTRQQEAMDEVGQMLETMKQSNFAHGVDFDPVDAKTYFPGVVTNAPEASGIPVYRPGTEMTSRPGWAKTRQIPTLREGLAAGVQYDDDIAALTIRLTGGAEANADRWAVQQVQGLGAKPSEKVSVRLRDNLREAQLAYQATRKKAVAARRRPKPEGGQAIEVQEAIEAEIALDQAKAAMRAEANRVSALRPRVFGRVVSPDVSKELSRYLATEDMGVVADMLHLWRGTMVTGDHSSMLNQNMMLFFRNNPAWMKSAAISSLAFKEAPYAWAARNSDAIEAAIRTGFASAPTEFLLRQGGGISGWFAKLPVIRQSQRGFEWNIFIGQVERYKAAAAVIKDPQALMEMAAVSRKSTGLLWTPGATKAQTNALRATFFAPQYTTAFISLLADPLTKTGAARREAIKSLSLMFGGAASTVIGFNMLINGEMPNIDDPKKAGYWGIRVGGGYVYPLGPFQPLIRALALTAEGDRKAMPRFFEAKASVPGRIVLRALEAMGAPFESIRGPSYSDPTQVFGEKGLGESFEDIAPSPIGASQAIEGFREGAPITGLEIAGGRTTIETPFQKFRRLYQEKHGEAVPEGVSARTLDPELAAQAGYSETTPFREERAEVTAPEEEQLGDLARIVLRGDPKAMQRFSDELGDFFRFRSGVTETLVQKFNLPEREASLVQEYYDLDPRGRRDPETGQPDYEYFEGEQERILRELRRKGASQAATALEQGTGVDFKDEDLQRVYDAQRELKDGLDSYYEIESDEREDYRRSHPEVDAKLYLLGRVSRVVGAGAERQVRRLSRRLLGTAIEASRGAEETSGTGRRGPSRRGP